MENEREPARELMSPKVDYVFKRIFGDERNIDILIDFLAAVLIVPKEKLATIELVNTELSKEHADERQGRLDVRVKTSEGKQINIEIQVSPIKHMPERSLFYLSKMYVSQITPGTPYSRLRQCIAINIVDFKCTPEKMLYSAYEFRNVKTGNPLTHIQMVYFLELPKLLDEDIQKDEDDPIVQWMLFLKGNRGAMQAMAKKNEATRQAFNYLEIISQDENERMLYEARQKELSDIATIKEEGVEEGFEIGFDQTIRKAAEKMLSNGFSVEVVVEILELPRDSVEEIKRSLEDKGILKRK